MTPRRLALTTALACLWGGLALAQEPPKTLPPQPKEVPKDKDKDKPPPTTTDPTAMPAQLPEEEKPPIVRPAVPGDVIDPQYRGTYVHGTTTINGGVVYNGPGPNGLFRAPQFHFGGFTPPAPYWPALSLPDYYWPGWGIHSQYFGYTPYTYGMWNTNPIPSPLAGGATYPDATLRPGETIPTNPMPPPVKEAPDSGRGSVESVPSPRVPGVPTPRAAPRG
jgi:hypothetical protein